jgi:hypothetical protein
MDTIPKQGFLTGDTDKSPTAIYGSKTHLLLFITATSSYPLINPSPPESYTT